jgi:excisionase family DNA binding protein
MHSDRPELELVANGLATVPQACEYLKISRAKLYVLMDAGDVRFCKLGKSRRIPWNTLRELAAAALVG